MIYGHPIIFCKAFKEAIAGVAFEKIMITYLKVSK
jgi:hypothetical protein